jgi:aryl-alcohol dehydrogenase-like predicted oxidoreductase
MLRYCLEQSVNAAVLVGFTTPRQVTENLAAPAHPLTAEDMSFIRDTAGSIQRRLDAAGEVFLDETKASRQ